MKNHLIVFSLFFALLSVGQTETEKEVLNLMNQVRTNPQLFLKDVALPYIDKNELKRNRYAKSLIRELEKKDSIQPLKFESALQEMSEEFAEEAGRRGWVGHRRVDQRFKKYADHLDVTAENLQYGYKVPIDIVMDLLIDFDIPNLGHRKNILDESFSLVGISIDEHKSYEFITVLSFGGFVK
jgi:uncharacterized protein YkwD